MENADDRRELYNRFLREIGSSSTVFFDEDDLIELYDYAGDIDDNFVRAEVLRHGARLYPESVRLAERRAYYYYDEGNDSAATMALGLLPEDSVLGKLLKMRLGIITKKDAESTLEYILSTNSDLGDEEVIQLANTASAVGMYGWLRDNRKKVEEASGYPQAFIYELEEIAQDYGDFETALDLYEELTMLEPFNAEFWLGMAEICIAHLKDTYRAMNAIDYALAIDPESRRALIMKAQCLYESDSDPDLVEELLCKAIELDPEDSTPIYALSMIYANTDNRSRSIELLTLYYRNHPGDRQTMDYLLMITDGNISDSMIDECVVVDEQDDPKSLETWARRHLAEGHLGAAAKIMARGDAKGKLPAESLPFLYEMLYRNGRYSEVVMSFERHFGKPSDVVSVTDTVSALFYILSCLRLERSDELEMFIVKAVAASRALSLWESYDVYMKSIGTTMLLMKAAEYVDRPGSFTLDEIDPFIKYRPKF